MVRVMGMIVQHNLPSLKAYNANTGNVYGIKRASEKLSTGYRINRAADDAAGLAVSEKMRTQIRGLKQSVRNSQDGIDLIQTFEGALATDSNILHRMKELAVESANGTYDNPVDRAALQLEFAQLRDEITQIAGTDFNGVVMLRYEPPPEKVPEPPVVIEVIPHAENYRIAADYLGGAFDANGVFAPQYTANNETIKTVYQNGTTESITGKINGTYLDNNGVRQNISYDYNVAIGGATFTQNTTTDADGNKVCTSTCQISFALGATGETAVINFTQKAVQHIQYLTTQNGTLYPDKHGNLIMTGLMWDQSYEISLADTCSDKFKLSDATMKYFSDTVLNADSYERYYTPQSGGKFIDHEVLYSGSRIIDSFSMYYFDPNNETFSALSNRVNIATDSKDGPDQLLLGLYGRHGATTDLQPINPGNDLACTFFWNDKKAKNGVITFDVGSRGLVNPNTDNNVSEEIIVTEVEEIVEEESDKVIVSVPNYFKNNRAQLTYVNTLALQVGARTKDEVNFAFSYSSSEMGDLAADLDCTSEGLGLEELSLLTQEDANDAIDHIKHSLSKISMIRSLFGSVQNRLEHKINNLVDASTNLTDAESRIRDTDMAQEMMNLTKSQILQQASQSMLSQTAQLPQSILSLLS